MTESNKQHPEVIRALRYMKRKGIVSLFPVTYVDEEIKVTEIPKDKV
jgi:hypothetical protein